VWAVKMLFSKRNCCLSRYISLNTIKRLLYRSYGRLSDALDALTVNEENIYI
jgi:hypothetical protein